jgi:glucose-6-phosphate-specific signal transduction histidine kinase
LILHSGSEDISKTTLNRWTILEVTAQTVALLALVRVIFGPHFGPYSSLYLNFIPIIWIAMRQGIRGVAVGLLALNFGFVVSSRPGTLTPEMVLKIGLLLFAVSATGLIVGATVTERHRIAQHLQDPVPGEPHDGCDESPCQKARAHRTVTTIGG